MGDIDFKVISTPENSNKFQKSRFWKEKSVEDLDEFTLGPMAQATPVIVMQEGNNLISQSAIFILITH